MMFDLFFQMFLICIIARKILPSGISKVFSVCDPIVIHSVIFKNKKGCKKHVDMALLIFLIIQKLLV